MLRCWPLWLVWIAACGGKDATDGDTDDTTPSDTDQTDTDTEACEATVVGVEPGDDGTMPADGVIVATFSDAIQDTHPFDIVVTPAGDAGPLDGSLALASDGLSATFTPSTPLDYEADYDLTVSVCEHEVSGSFSTLPQPLDPATLEGRTYGLLVDDVTWHEPQNLSIFDLNLDYVLVQVTDVDVAHQTLQPIATTGDASPFVGEPPVPTCSMVMDAPVTDFSHNPAFQVGPTDLTYPYGDGTSVTIENFSLEASFSADGSEIVDVRVTGLFDPSQVIQIDCGTAALLLQGRCLPCASGECLVVDARAPSAPWFDGLDIVAECAL